MAAIYMRQATLSDLPTIMAIINEAKELLKKDGSPQWQDGRPNEEILTNDINHKHCFVLIYDHSIASTVSLTGTDPHYAEIDGQWHNNTDPYYTIHRIAISSQFRGKHLTNYLFSNIITYTLLQGIKNIRIDTHEINKRMQGLSLKFGFEYRGIVRVAEGETGLRYAYELNL